MEGLITRFFISLDVSVVAFLWCFRFPQEMIFFGILGLTTVQCIVELLQCGGSVAVAVLAIPCDRCHVTGDIWHMILNRWQVTGDQSFFLFLIPTLCFFLLFITMVILSALVERLSVSRMQDFFLLQSTLKKLGYWIVFSTHLFLHLRSANGLKVIH